MDWSKARCYKTFAFAQIHNLKGINLMRLFVQMMVADSNWDVYGTSRSCGSSGSDSINTVGELTKERFGSYENFNNNI